MKSFAVAALAGIASAHLNNPALMKFAEYMAKFNKNYDSFDEYKLRFHHFETKEDFINEHNEIEANTYKVGHNHMSDWATWEYEQILTYMAEPTDKFAKHVEPMTTVTNNDPVDWRDTKYLAPIKDQGQCGSCWAFSTIGSLESAHAITNDVDVQQFSEQQLVDCVGTCFGCNGGNVMFANRYLKTHPAISEGSYPYTAENGTCEDDSIANTGVMTTGTINVTPEDIDAMKTQLAVGPISVAIQANKLCFQLYTSGIFNNSNCGGSTLDHAVMLVGWGIDETDSSVEYWILRNSWATTWGEEGYMRLQTADGIGYCGVQTEPQAPKGVN